MNDSMGSHVAQETVKLMINNDIAVKNSNILMLGITFKENCPDIRNSRAIDIVTELKSFKVNVDVFDPWANAEEVKEEYDIDLISSYNDIRKKYDAIIAAVAHNEFLEIDIDLLKDEKAVVFDVKSFLPKEKVDGRL